jgi:hypothetical protein
MRNLPIGRALISQSGFRIVKVIVSTSVARRVGIHDGIHCHYPAKRSDCFSDITRVYRRSLAKRIKHLPRASKAFVQKSVEVLLQYCVGGEMIEQVPPQGDVGSARRDQIPTPLRPPDATSARMVRIDTIDPEQAQSEHHRQRENQNAYL